MVEVSIEEKEDMQLILRTFGPMSWGCLAMFYNNSFSKARGRRFTSSQLQAILVDNPRMVAEKIVG
jgi:hypothetical protein